MENIDYSFAIDSDRFNDKRLRLEVVPTDSTLTASRKRARVQEDQPARDLIAEDCPPAVCPKNSSNKEVVPTDSTLTASRKRARVQEDQPERDLIAEDCPPAVRQKNSSNQESEASAGGIDIDNTELLKQKSINRCEADDEEEASGNTEDSHILRVQEIRVSAVLLASQSAFFRKLFTNGMKETDQDTISLQLSEEEVEPVQEIINFIYKGAFIKVDPKSLLNTLVAADKFEVLRAMKVCIDLMVGSEKSVEAAIVYLDFQAATPAVLEALKPVKDECGRYLANRFKDILSHEKELLQMPLSAIVRIFSSSELIVPLEDSVYCFLMKWVTLKYSSQDIRIAVFNKILIYLVRIMHLSADGVKRLEHCCLIPEKADRLTLCAHANSYKADNCCARVPRWVYAPRVYLTKTVKVTCFYPYPELSVHMHFTVKDCQRMVISGNPNSISSEMFSCFGYTFSLVAVCKMDEVTNTPTSLGLYLRADQSSLPPIGLAVALAVRQWPSGYFITRHRFVSAFSGGQAFGLEDLFSCSWSQLTGDGSIFMVHDRLHLSVQITRQP